MPWRRGFERRTVDGAFGPGGCAPGENNLHVVIRFGPAGRCCQAVAIHAAAADGATGINLQQVPTLGGGKRLQFGPLLFE